MRSLTDLSKLFEQWNLFIWERIVASTSYDLCCCKVIYDFGYHLALTIIISRKTTAAVVVACDADSLTLYLSVEKRIFEKNYLTSQRSFDRLGGYVWPRDVV